ncbi:MAG: hypothetical protein K5819_03845 [Lachnospiraceae bacterium]|nr:hypothetical protein [Lachnospiraceae bacterium]
MNWEGSSAYSMNPLRIKMKDRKRYSPGEGEKGSLRGKTPGIGAARKESREEKTPGKGEKGSQRGKTPGIGAVRKESRGEKSPGEGEKGSQRGKIPGIGAARKESRGEKSPGKGEKGSLRGTGKMHTRERRDENSGCGWNKIFWDSNGGETACRWS